MPFSDSASDRRLLLKPGLRRDRIQAYIDQSRRTHLDYVANESIKIAPFVSKTDNYRSVHQCSQSIAFHTRWFGPLGDPRALSRSSIPVTKCPAMVRRSYAMSRRTVATLPSSGSPKPGPAGVAAARKSRCLQWSALSPRANCSPQSADHYSQQSAIIASLLVRLGVFVLLNASQSPIKHVVPEVVLTRWSVPIKYKGLRG